MILAVLALEVMTECMCLIMGILVFNSQLSIFSVGSLVLFSGITYFSFTPGYVVL